MTSFSNITQNLLKHVANQTVSRNLGDTGGTPSAVRWHGPATLTMTGTNTHTGPTLVNGGTLSISGSSTPSPHTVAAGASLSGNSSTTGSTGPLVFSAADSVYRVDAIGPTSVSRITCQSLSAPAGFQVDLWGNVQEGTYDILERLTIAMSDPTPTLGINTSTGMTATFSWFGDILQMAVFPCWSPAFLTTDGWYDASDPTTITESGGFVSQLDDKSGNARHLKQPLGQNQPITGDFTVGNGPLPSDNKSAIRFDGFYTANDILVTDDNAAWLENTEYSVFSAMRHIFYDSESQFCGIEGPGEGSMILGAYVSGEWTLAHNSTPGIAPIGQGIPWALSPEIPIITATTFTNPGYQAWIDGVSIGTSVLPNTPITNALKFNLGRGGTSFYSFDGQIGEVIVTTGTLTADTRTTIEGYLAWKWNLVANLPPGHPHAAQPPPCP
jgi:autotransporter-associated beta strand protein